MIKKILSLTCVSLVTAACAGESTPQIQALQRKDKQLSCKELLLEMNEAQFYKKAAQKNKGPQLKNVLMPLGYISTYMDAQEAIETASARIDYLDKVYNIMDCEKQESASAWQPAPVNSGYQQSMTHYMGAMPSRDQYAATEPAPALTNVPPAAPYGQENGTYAAVPVPPVKNNQKFW